MSCCRCSCCCCCCCWRVRGRPLRMRSATAVLGFDAVALVESCHADRVCAPRGKEKEDCGQLGVDAEDTAVLQAGTTEDARLLQLRADLDEKSIKTVEAMLAEQAAEIARLRAAAAAK